MKKNLISMIILALVLADLILTAVLTISVVPQSNKANKLIEKVCNAIDLDLEGGGYVAKELDVPLEQIVNYSLSEGETMTINLAPGSDGTVHYAITQVTLGLNSKHEDYGKYGTAEQLKDKEGMLKGIVYDVIGSHTSEELRGDREAIRQELLTAICEMYGSSFVATVSFTAGVQ